MPDNEMSTNQQRRRARNWKQSDTDRLKELLAQGKEREEIQEEFQDFAESTLNRRINLAEKELDNPEISQEEEEAVMDMVEKINKSGSKNAGIVPTESTHANPQLQEPLNKEKKRKLYEIESYESRMTTSEDLGVYWSMSKELGVFSVLLCKFIPSMSYQLKFKNDTIEVTVSHELSNEEYAALATRNGTTIKSIKYFYPKFTKTITIHPPCKINFIEGPPVKIEGTNLFVKDFPLVEFHDAEYLV